MRRTIAIATLMLALVVPAIAGPAHGPVTASVSVCFTPGEDCENEIVKAIRLARLEIEVQAYYLTSTRILRALRDAIARGVKVEATLDKVQRPEAECKRTRGRSKAPNGPLA